jgi:hypothetical protein
MMRINKRFEEEPFIVCEQAKRQTLLTSVDLFLTMIMMANWRSLMANLRS